MFKWLLIYSALLAASPKSTAYAGVVASYGGKARSCIKLDADSADGSLLSDIKPGIASIKAPGRLTLTLTPTTECLQFLTENTPAAADKTPAAADKTPAEQQPLLVVRIRFSSDFSQPAIDDEVKLYGFDEAAIKHEQSVTVVSRRLASEGIVYMNVEADVVLKSQAQGALDGSPGAAPISFRYSTKTTSINVLDTDFLHSLGYRVSVPFLARFETGGHTEKYALGASTSLLFYPLRLTSRISSPFDRKIAAELILGTATGVIKKTADRTFYFAGIGITYDGVIGIGYARDISNSETFGFYFNITIFSEKGLFGLVPVTSK